MGADSQNAPDPRQPKTLDGKTIHQWKAAFAALAAEHKALRRTLYAQSKLLAYAFDAGVQEGLNQARTHPDRDVDPDDLILSTLAAIQGS